MNPTDLRSNSFLSPGKPVSLSNKVYVCGQQWGFLSLNIWRSYTHVTTSRPKYGVELHISRITLPFLLRYVYSKGPQVDSLLCASMPSFLLWFPLSLALFLFISFHFSLPGDFLLSTTQHQISPRESAFQFNPLFWDLEALSCSAFGLIKDYTMYPNK